MVCIMLHRGINNTFLSPAYLDNKALGLGLVRGINGGSSGVEKAPGQRVMTHGNLVCYRNTDLGASTSACHALSYINNG